MLVLNVIIGFLVFGGIVIFILKKVIFTQTNVQVKQINEAMKRNDKLRLEMEQKVKDCEEACRVKMETAKTEAGNILKEARSKSEEEAKEALERAKKQGEEIVEKANTAKEKIKNDIIKEMDFKALEFASRVFLRVMEKTMSEKLNDILVQDFILGLESLETKYISAEVSEAEVISRYKLSDSTKEKIKQAIDKKLKRKIQLTDKVEEGVLAGIVLRFGTLAIDASLASKIKETCEQIKKETETKK